MTGRTDRPATATDAQFERELKAFERQVAEPTQFLFAEMAIEHVARRNARTRGALNVTPMFWNTVLGALDYAAIVAVGRIFDQGSKGSPHTVDRIVRLADQNRQVFSEDALAARKRREGKADEWLPAFLDYVHVPTTEDFRRLRRLINRHRTVYKTQFADIRHKHLAHTVVIDDEEISAIFSKARVADLERLIVFLNQLHEALWQMFYNGQRPTLQRMPFSSRSLVRRRFDDPRNMTVQERIVTDVKRCLRLLTQANKRAALRRAGQRRVRLRKTR